MAWSRRIVVTNNNVTTGKSGPYQVRLACDGSDPKLVKEILDELENHLDNCWGNYTGEEYSHT